MLLGEVCDTGLLMKKMKANSSFTCNFSTSLAIDFTTGFPIGFTNEIGFIDGTTCAPTILASLAASSMDEDEALPIPIEKLLALDNIL